MDSYNNLLVAFHYKSEIRVAYIVRETTFDSIIKTVYSFWEELKSDVITLKYVMLDGVLFNTSILVDLDVSCMYELHVRQSLTSAKLKLFDEAFRVSICDSQKNTHRSGQECEFSLQKDICRRQHFKKPIVDWINSGSSSLKAKRKMIELFKNELTEVGQEFDNVKYFRDALRNYAIAWGFNYKLMKSEPQRVKAQCAKENYAWQILVTLVGECDIF